MDPERVRATDSYMNAIGVGTRLETSIQQALQGIGDFKPDGVVLSVEILKHNSLQAAQLIEATYGTTVALFSETGSISNLPYEIQRSVIIAPASGPKVLMRLQTLIDRKTSMAPQTIRDKNAPERKARLTGSALEAAIFMALDKLLKTSFQVAKGGFTKLEKVAGVGVKSPIATGYLIANFSQDLGYELDLRQIEIESAPGLGRTEVQSQYVAQWELDGHDILEWANEEALFWAPMESGPGKLNLIFVETPIASDHLRPSPVPKMTSIELASIPTDEELPTPLLLWLAANQRLIPYIKAQTALLPDQKDRLLRNGIDTLEVHKEDEAALLQHLIRSDIERTLRQHQTPKATTLSEP